MYIQIIKFDSWVPYEITSRTVDNQTCFGTSLRLRNNVQSWPVLLCDTFSHVCQLPNSCAHQCADVSARMCSQHNLHHTDHT